MENLRTGEMTTKRVYMTYFLWSTVLHDSHALRGDG
jgi:hypothetical protein